MTTDATDLLRRRIRQEAGLSIRDLERLTGINRGMLSMYERGMSVSHDMEEIIERALKSAAQTT